MTLAKVVFTTMHFHLSVSMSFYRTQILSQAGRETTDTGLYCILNYDTWRLCLVWSSWGLCPCNSEATMSIILHFPKKREGCKKLFYVYYFVYFQ